MSASVNRQHFSALTLSFFFSFGAGPNQSVGQTVIPPEVLINSITLNSGSSEGERIGERERGRKSKESKRMKGSEGRWRGNAAMERDSRPLCISL